LAIFENSIIALKCHPCLKCHSCLQCHQSHLNAIPTSQQSAGLLSAAFLDLYLPWQPNLLLALLCLLIASLLSLLLLLGMLVRTRFSRFLAVNGQMGGGTSEDEVSANIFTNFYMQILYSINSQKTPQRQPRFRLLLCFCVVLWLLLLAGSVLFSSTLVELISVGGGGHGQEEPMAASEALLMDEEMAAAAAGREQRSEDGAAGEMLGKVGQLFWAPGNVHQKLSC
jgi:hypothetical protein